VLVNAANTASAESALQGTKDAAGATGLQTLDPLIKSHQVSSIRQAHFDTSAIRSGVEPEGKLENVETKTKDRPETTQKRRGA
jgi:hypothetical protein